MKTKPRINKSISKLNVVCDIPTSQDKVMNRLAINLSTYLKLKHLMEIKGQVKKKSS